VIETDDKMRKDQKCILSACAVYVHLPLSHSLFALIKTSPPPPTHTQVLLNPETGKMQCAGAGLFNGEDRTIHKGEVIAEYGGEVIYGKDRVLQR